MLKNKFPATIVGGLENLTRKRLRIAMILLSLVVALIATVWITRTAASAATQPAAKSDLLSASWTIEQVENNRYFYEMRDRSLAYDAINEHLYYAYGGDHLYFAEFDGTNWNSEVVDNSPAVGSFASLAIDQAGNPHIAYYDATNGTLKYATKFFGTWFISTLDTPTMMSTGASEARQPIDPLVGPDLPVSKPWLNEEFVSDSSTLLAASGATRGVGQYTSIAIDSQNRPHISYYQFDLNDRNYNHLKYAYWDGSSWKIKLVQEPDAAGNKAEGKYSSIALDGLDHPHIAFLDDDYDDLRHAYIGDKGRWNWENIADGPYHGNVGGWVSIAIDNANNCHISFYAKTSGGLWYAKGTKCSNPDAPGRAWTVVKADDTAADVGLYSSLFLHSGINISYYDATNGNLKLAHSTDGTSWSRSVISGTKVNVGLYTSLVMDNDHKLHITFFNVSYGLLQEAYQGGTGKWSFRTIDENHDVGLATSLDLDSTDKPFISYLDDSPNDLKMAERTGPATWATSRVTGTNSIGSYTSLKIDSTGKPRIAFYDATRKDLNYAEWNGSAWAFTSVDRNGDVGQYPSLALDINDKPFISYYDATEKRLLLAYWNISASKWITTPVDQSTFSPPDINVGKFSSIALDNTAQPLTKVFISYYEDAPNYRLKMAYRNIALGPPEWRKYVVDDITDSEVGQFTSLALTNSWQPRIAYYEKTHTYLKYAEGTWTGSTFTFNTETVHKVDHYDIGKYASLGLDSSNQPHISYYFFDSEGTHEGDLMYARKVGGVWEKYTVDSDGDVGLFTSIAIDGADLPHISYYDKTLGELKYAFDPILPSYTNFIYLPSIMQ
jgi:hypothetical protein